MSDLMRQVPFGQLMEWIISEYYFQDSVFGTKKFFDQSSPYTYEIFGEKPELPFGPAAGPHTQLSQNLITSYITGARFFELKTVQVLDGEDLPVSKPCITAADEGYNVEWSTELYVPQALDEYIKAWYAIKLISREFGLGREDGFVFNMSVGYDLNGIKSNKIDSFIEGLKNAETTDYWSKCKRWAENNLTRFDYVDKHMIDNISPKVSNSITLSTLHGCPPEEIEQIARYLILEKGLHTYVKCNPTLLGYDYARKTMDSLGYDYLEFDDTHFKADMQFEDAVPMFKRLHKLAKDMSLEFGVKLTNTFPVKINDNQLPGEEMYMSGRALFPLSIEVAKRLTEALNGSLRISFSGGADIRNIEEIYKTGIWPITLATTLLKPGGYERLHQIATEFIKFKHKESNKTPEKQISVNEKIDIKALKSLVDKVQTDVLYKKPTGIPPIRKINKKVPLIDCYIAPCMNGCPFGQDVPAYLKLTGEGKYLEALQIITEKNPLPFITGTICSHNCMTKCTRNFYESSINIRSEKLKAVENAYNELMSGLNPIQLPINREKVAIIGGGPAGLAVAYFLAKAGSYVTIFEKRDSLGGIVQHVIPEFRISNESVNKDIALVEAMGIDVKLNSEITDINALRSDGYKHIVIATGVWFPGVLRLEGKEPVDALEILKKIKNNPNSVKFGENVVVVGGGNTAIDTARAAKRAKDVKNVSIVYRRTKRFMPADVEELQLAIDEGIEFNELLTPLSHKNRILSCKEMELGTPDESGRRSPVPTGKIKDIPADTVISAVGNRVDLSMFDISSENVYVIGDAKNGPATIAEAIADAAECASKITDITFDKYVDKNISDDIRSAENKKGILYCNTSKVQESERCLECATICRVCADVCPNRANICVIIDGREQVVHLDYLCNECGNCEIFCPYESAPYLDKMTFYIYKQDFDNSKNNGFVAMEDGSVLLRMDGKITNHRDGKKLPSDIWRLIEESLKQFNRWYLQ
ncbi:MAG: putative selenate reductase subunit YgfK [Oscillospiraceae bacterium]|jgi:putative selenate reductase|nr:putative selenate reductase subunit YgfK [Oscillospiraceae bacterium]